MTAIQRRAGLRRKAFRRKPSEMLDQDMAWGRAVIARDRRCTFPHGEVPIPCFGRLEAHHVIGRAHRATRWDPDNGTALCGRSHTWVTDLEGGRAETERLGLIARPGTPVVNGRAVQG